MYIARSKIKNASWHRIVVPAGDTLHLSCGKRLSAKRSETKQIDTLLEIRADRLCGYCFRAVK